MSKERKRTDTQYVTDVETEKEEEEEKEDTEVEAAEKDTLDTEDALIGGAAATPASGMRNETDAVTGQAEAEDALTGAASLDTESRSGTTTDSRYTGRRNDS